MAKVPVEGGWDLAIGEPEFLYAREGFRVTADELEGYPPLTGTEHLLSRLRFVQPGYKHHVVTCGAKQALHAAVYAIMRVLDYEVDSLVHSAPYWPSHATVARNTGLEFLTVPERRYSLSVLTSPNNPDGRQYNMPVDIWDAVYAHPMYGWNGQVPPHKVAVFSAAKLLGYSGCRIGWLATDNGDLARHAALYVEGTTSGVSRADQFALATAAPERFHGIPGALHEWLTPCPARNVLLTNAILFHELLGDHVEEVQGLPGPEAAGMFAWFRPTNPVNFRLSLHQAQVRLVPGAACGMEGWWRMNLGLTTETLEKALSALATALET